MSVGPLNRKNIPTRVRPNGTSDDVWAKLTAQHHQHMPEKLLLFRTFVRKENYPLSIPMAEKFLLSQRKGRENFHPVFHGQKFYWKSQIVLSLPRKFWKQVHENLSVFWVYSEMQLKWGSLTGLCFILTSFLLITELLAENTSPEIESPVSGKNDVFTSSFLVRFRRSVDNDEAHAIAGQHDFENLGPVSTNLLKWKPIKLLIISRKQFYEFSGKINFFVRFSCEFLLGFLSIFIMIEMFWKFWKVRIKVCIFPIFTTQIRKLTEEYNLTDKRVVVYVIGDCYHGW